MVITIDGPAGSGKSTIAKTIARKLKFLYIDTGAMYRGITLKAVNKGIDLDDVTCLVQLTKQTEICFEDTGDDELKIFCDGEDVSAKIRDPQLTNLIFKIAQIPQIRELMVDWQRQYGKRKNIVIEGRDIGTVVFPNAEKKFYLDASPRIRAERRLKQLNEKGVLIDLNELIRQINDRDYKDKTRAHGPLIIAPDAIYIDTTNLDLSAVVELVMKYVQEKNEK